MSTDAQGVTRGTVEVRDALPADYEAVGSIVVAAFDADGQLAEPGSASYADDAADP